MFPRIVPLMLLSLMSFSATAQQPSDAESDLEAVRDLPASSLPRGTKVTLKKRIAFGPGSDLAPLKNTSILGEPGDQVPFFADLFEKLFEDKKPEPFCVLKKDSDLESDQPTIIRAGKTFQLPNSENDADLRPSAKSESFSANTASEETKKLAQKIGIETLTMINVPMLSPVGQLDGDVSERLAPYWQWEHKKPKVGLGTDGKIVIESATKGFENAMKAKRLTPEELGIENLASGYAEMIAQVEATTYFKSLMEEWNAAKPFTPADQDLNDPQDQEFSLVCGVMGEEPSIKELEEILSGVLSFEIPAPKVIEE